MKHSERFENAVTKLYNAFHEGTLDAGNCEHCAVGNIVGHGNWHGYDYASKGCNYDVITGLTKNHFRYPTDSSYSSNELMDIERIFLEAQLNLNMKKKETQFKALSAVVEYLCELEGIENIMDYQSLFNPKRELELTQIF